MNAECRMRNAEWGRNALCAVILTIGLAACDSTPTELTNYHPQPVLSGFLYNGEPVSEIFLERVASIYGYYDPKDHGIVGATIRIYGGGDTLILADDPAYHGRYIPAVGQSLIPKGKILYRIEATTPDSEFVWAQAVVPDTFAWVDIYLSPDHGQTCLPVHEGDTLTRLDPNMYWEWSDVKAVGGFAGVIDALTPRDSLIPLDPKFDPAKDSVKADERSKADYTVMRDDERKITLAWIFFRWAGPQRIELQAISRDYYEYLYTLQRVEQGMLSNPASNIIGGLGIFAGISRRSITIVMKRDPLQ